MKKVKTFDVSFWLISFLLASPITLFAQATDITMVSANNQTDTINAVLDEQPFAVRVTGALGAHIPGVTVTFSAETAPSGATGHGVVYPSVVTDADGIAQTFAVLGNKVGAYTYHATVSGLTGSPVILTATATTGAAFSIDLVSGNAQSDTINSVITNPYVVRVTDVGSNPLSGIVVTFAIAGTPVSAAGQSLSFLTRTTNASGFASSTLTLGNMDGVYTVTASATGLSGSPVSFTSTATHGVAAMITQTSGSGQSKSVLTALDNPFVATVSDRAGNPVPGVAATFAITGTPVSAIGQSLSSSGGTSDINGQVNTILTVGNKLGTYTVTASATGLSGSPVSFTATATPGTATTITETSGNGQSKVISNTLDNAFVVTVTDSLGYNVSGVVVTFAITGTPASATGQTLSFLTRTTDVNGQAGSTLTLGNKVGTYTVTASVTGLTGSPVSFTSTATTGTAASISLVSGNGQSDTINSVLVNPYIVQVVDAGSNPVSGTEVTFAITGTPASATGQTLSVLTRTTDTSGFANDTLTLGDKLGTYTVTASATGLSGSPVSFTSTATHGNATTITQTSGSGQSKSILAPLDNPFVATVNDRLGNPVPSVIVAFAITGTPGGASGQVLSALLDTTDASGQVSTILTVGDKLGSYTVTASVTGLTGSPVSFTSTATTGAATSIGLVSGNAQSDTINSVLVNPYVVRVVDAGSNPVSGTEVTFAITGTPASATGQALSVITDTTDASGIASSILTLGNKVGTYTVTASATGLSGSPVSFTSVATRGAAVSIGLISGSGQTDTVNAVLPNPFIVRVLDGGSNPVSGDVVTFAITGTPASATGQALSFLTRATDASGLVSDTLTLGNKLGIYTVTASVSGLSGSPVSFTATAIHGNATTITQTSGSGQSKGVVTTLDNPLVATVTDRLGDPVPGVIVTFAIARTPPGAGGQILSALLDTTDVSGQVSTILRLGDKLGVYTVTASAVGLSGSPVSFTDTAITGTAARIRPAAATEYLMELTGTAFTENPFDVRISDAGDNPVSGYPVTFTIISAPTGATGQVLSGTVVNTDAGGHAATTLTLGDSVGNYVVQASGPGLDGSPLTYTVQAVSGIASIAVKAFLQGPYNTGTGLMNMSLNTGGHLASHFNTPWYPETAVDSIQIEIRDSASAAASTIRAFSPAWSMTDGTIRYEMSSGSPVSSYVKLIAPPGSYYVVVHHRNHLAIMSAGKVVLNRIRTDYDFTTAQTQAYGTNPMVALGDGFYGMYAGDANGDGVVKYNLSNNDRLLIYNRIGNAGLNVTLNGYYSEDLNLDGIVKYNLSNNDRLLIYNVIGNSNLNVTKTTQVPN